MIHPIGDHVHRSYFLHHQEPAIRLERSTDFFRFKDHCAYTMARYGMSLCALGMAEEFRAQGVAVNALWPHTIIHTAALAMLQGMVKPENCRTSEIVADAAHAILTRDSHTCSGRFFIDEEVLREEGVIDFSHYAVDPNGVLLQDLFVD